MLLENFDKFEKEAGRALEEGLVHPAYDYVLKMFTYPFKPA